MPPILELSELFAPRFKEAFAYWRSKLAGRQMPSRRDIDPVDIPALLPYVLLTDVLREPLDFRFRLIGTEVRSISERDYTGKRYSEVPGKGKGSIVWTNCETVVCTRAPFFGTPPYVGPDRYLRRCETILLPLSENGSDVNMILQVVSFGWERRGL